MGKLTEQLKPLHDRLSSVFRGTQGEKVEKRYGVITLVGFVSAAYELSYSDLSSLFYCL